MSPKEAIDRVCPTRTDGRESLFAHKVTHAQCQQHQRQSYHKCFTCAHNNARLTSAGLPPVSKRSVTAKQKA